MGPSQVRTTRHQATCARRLFSLGDERTLWQCDSPGHPIFFTFLAGFFIFSTCNTFFKFERENGEYYSSIILLASSRIQFTQNRWSKLTHKNTLNAHRLPRSYFDFAKKAPLARPPSKPYWRRHIAGTMRMPKPCHLSTRNTSWRDPIF